MGYIIMSRLDADGDRRYVAWMEDDQPIMAEMSRWMRTGESFEILEYVSGEDSPLYDTTTHIYRWRDAFNREKLEQEQ